jgi:rare lipoprotein A
VAVPLSVSWYVVQRTVVEFPVYKVATRATHAKRSFSVTLSRCDLGFVVAMGLAQAGAPAYLHAGVNAATYDLDGGMLRATAIAAVPKSVDETGTASVYGDRLQGRATASGEPYDRDMLTAAHRTLPLGSRARVTNLKNNKSVIVRINDRGPHTAGRILDLSRSAAERLGLRTGVIRVRVELISPPPS